MDDNEVIFVTRGPKCFMYNGAGHNLKVHKSEEIRPRTLARVGGDMMVGVCKKKPCLNAWILGESKHKIKETFTIPGHATALAVSSCGQYCFVGIGKDLYVWKLTSGCLLSVIQQHYQDLSCIKVSADDDMVITGGKDGHVNVWLLVDLVQASDTSERRKTQFSWTNHSNEVTDIFNTPQGSCGRLATVSLDTTCRLYELNTGSLLTTVCLDVALSAVTMDTLECFIFCGDIFGELHCINIYEGLQREIHGNDPVNKKIKIHEQKIVNLEVNFDGSLLLTASEDCIKVFMLDSFSLMTRIDEENCFGGITNAMFLSIPLEALMDEKYTPFSKIASLRRNLEESREDKPLTCTRISARPPIAKTHYMEDTSILSHYIPCKYIDARSIGMADDDPRKEIFDNAFERLSSGPTVTEITGVNHQLYKMSCEKALENYILKKKLKAMEAKMKEMENAEAKAAY